MGFGVAVAVIRVAIIFISNFILVISLFGRKEGTTTTLHQPLPLTSSKKKQYKPIVPNHTQGANDPIVPMAHVTEGLKKEKLY